MLQASSGEKGWQLMEEGKVRATHLLPLTLSSNILDLLIFREGQTPLLLLPSACSSHSSNCKARDWACVVPGAVREAVEYHCSLGVNLSKHTAQLWLHLIIDTVMKYVFLSLVYFSCFKLLMMFFEIPFYRLPSFSFVCRQGRT